MPQFADAGEASGISTLARAIVAFRDVVLKTQQITRTQLLLLDTIGCGLLGAREDIARDVFAATERCASVCGLIGRPERVGILAAILCNGTAVRALDFNDYFIGESKGQPEAGGHPSDNIPVALAIGAACRVSGMELLQAIALGYEIYFRLQRLMDRAGLWDGVSASGLVAPAMAGFLMHLDEPRLANALALGVARSATPAIVRRGGIAGAKSIANALVAQSGVQAALLAARGITAPLNILDDARGLRHLFVNDNIAKLHAPVLGEAILAAHVKLFPCVNTAQCAVAAALDLHAQVRGQIADIERIELVMADYPVIQRQQDDNQRRMPNSREAADHSFPFLVAIALLDGALGIEQFAHSRWSDPKVVALMEKVVMRRDARWNTRAPGAFPCTIRLKMRHGPESRADASHPSAVSANLVTDKFHGNLSGILSPDARQRIVDAIMELHHSRSTAALDAAITAGEIR